MCMRGFRHTHPEKDCARLLADHWAETDSQSLSWSVPRLLPTLIILEHKDPTVVMSAIYACFLAKRLDYLFGDKANTAKRQQWGWVKPDWMGKAGFEWLMQFVHPPTEAAEGAVKPPPVPQLAVFSRPKRLILTWVIYVRSLINRRVTGFVRSFSVFTS